MRLLNAVAMLSSLLVASANRQRQGGGHVKLPPGTEKRNGDGPRPHGSFIGGRHVPSTGDSPAVSIGQPGVFNLYIFAMSWKAEWCYHQQYPGCESPRAFWKNNLTIHGLWPDFGNGMYPTGCTSEEFDHDRVVNSVGLDVLEDVWPNIHVEEGAGKKYDTFWEHEWSKHGTCTGLTQVEYFLASVSLLQDRFPTPAQLSADVGASVSRAELEDAYGGDGMAILQCDGDAKMYLNQVLLCLEVDPDTHMPSNQVVCPKAVVEHDDSCGQGEIHVASF